MNQLIIDQRDHHLDQNLDHDHHDHLDPAVAEGDLLQVRQLCDENILSQPRDLS